MGDNPRFLILPWIEIPNLGSHILALVRRRLPQDWAERYNTAPVLIETFVETPRYTGAVYRASGWIHVGTTQGRERYDRDKLYDKPAWRQPGHRQDRMTEKTLSAFRSNGRGLFRFRTATCCRRARISVWSAARSAKISMILCMPERAYGGDANVQSFCDRWNKWEGQPMAINEAQALALLPSLDHLGVALSPRTPQAPLGLVHLRFSFLPLTCMH